LCVYTPCTRERTVIIALRPPRAAMFLKPRKTVIGAEKDERKAFVVTEQDIIGRAIALDQLRLQQQRLCLTIRRHNRHAAGLRHHPAKTIWKALHLRIVCDPVLECFGLANIKHVAAGIMHPVNAGLCWQRF
jgi:hypothetical protein